MQQSLPLSILDAELDENEKNDFINYISGLSVTESGEITLSKIYEKTNIPYKKLAKVLLKYTEAGNLCMKYAVKCPKCRRLIKEINYENLEKAYKIKSCYICGENISVTDKDIIAIFSVVHEPPFYKGQNQNQISFEIFESAQECDTIYYLKGICDELKRSNDIEEKKADLQEQNNKIEDEISSDAYKLYKKNRRLRLVLNISLAVIIGLLIYGVTKTTDNARLSGTLSGITYILSFVFNNVIETFMPKDMDIIKMDLKEKRSNK